MPPPSESVHVQHESVQAPRQKSFYQRWGLSIAILTTVAIPFVFGLAAQAVMDGNNRVEDWLPKSFESTRELAWFRQHFSSEQFILISWEGCRLGTTSQEDDPRIEQLARLLVPNGALREESQAVHESPVTEGVSPDRFFKSVLTGRMVLDQLTGPPLQLEQQQAIERVRGTLIGDDGRQTCLLVTLTTEATQQLSAVVGRGQRRWLRPNLPPGIVWQMLDEVGIESASVHLGGPPIDNAAIDEEGKRTLVRLAGLSGLLGLGLAWWALKSVILTGLVFLCGIVSAATALAIVRITGGTADAILMSMPSLVFVLTISGAVHLISYYREAIEDAGMYRASERAVALAWKPAVLCSITTAVGLLSLLSSELVPIRSFGIYSASGVICLVGVTYFFLPAALQLTQVGRRWLHPAKDQLQSRTPHGSEFWTIVGNIILRHYRLVGSLCIVATMLTAYGLRYSTSSINLLKLFDSRARILKDYQWLEDRVGKLVPMELVVTFPTASDPSINQLSLLQRYEFVVRLQHLLSQRLGERGAQLIGSSMSAATFLPAIPAAIGNASYIQRKAIEARLQTLRPELEKTGFYRSTSSDGRELWRISMRVAAFEDIDYGGFVQELKQVAEPLLQAYDLRDRVLASLAEDLQTSGKRKQVLILGNTRQQPSPSSAVVANQRPSEDVDLLAHYLRSLLREYRCDVTSSETTLEIAPLEYLERLREFDAVVVGRAHAEHAHLAQGFAERVIVQNQAESAALGGDVQVVYTGVVPIVYQAQRALLNSLISSTGWSFLTITPIMMLVTRSFLAGIVAMLPNLLPILLIFGGMGWLSIPVDIGSMMTASIALGVAVDDTIHFLARYREALELGCGKQQAILTTYSQCAVPTLQAAMISGLGLSVFAFSTFTPTQRFGWLMLSILLAGVVAELLLLPAILASRLGDVFAIRRPVTATQPTTSRTADIVRLDAAHASKHPTPRSIGQAAESLNQ